MMTKVSRRNEMSFNRISVVIPSILLLLLFVLALSGCGSAKQAEDNFVGSWQGAGETTANDGLTYNQTVSLAVSSDGKWQMSQNIKGRVIGLTDNTTNYSGTWESSKNNITLRIIQTTGNTENAGKVIQGEYVPDTGNIILGSGFGTLTRVSK